MQSALLLLLLSVAPFAHCIPALHRELPQEDATESVDQTSLREMFEEVEELMEDTQQKLQGAAREMELKQGRMLRDLESVSANYSKLGARSRARNLTINALLENKKEYDLEQRAVSADLSQYMEMEEAPFLQLIALEGPGDVESYTYTIPDVEDVWAVGLDSVTDLYNKENPENHDDPDTM
ncbi:hypothetical protein chiPu_0010652 [Chiloscyllium punctatum]|uniref:Uncharacterized protein n=1 Tax=Chiloscyllium punctatum TaxID=137246 RepID=A0A401SP70_CHIPU|nr:hypothetical protein [Chiloscyllium punctatum]